MRAKLSGKPGWLYGILLFAGVLLTALVIRYAVDGGLSWNAVTSALLYASGFALMMTLLNRAFYPAQRGDHHTGPPTEHHDEP